ncbi:unnamed protein product [Rotaria sp. Silwood1]|nr:unnamed protein product [Rotaria sp. Silwood1]
MLHISQRKAALVAGWSILIMAILAGFAYGFVLQGLIVPDNTTLPMIIGELGFGLWLLFKGGILSENGSGSHRKKTDL